MIFFKKRGATSFFSGRIDLSNKFLLFFLLSLLLQGCSSPFSKYYYDDSGVGDVTKLNTVVIPTGEPKLYRGNVEEEDSLKMIENGYLITGHSSFNGSNVNDNDAIDQAKKFTPKW